MIVLIVSRVTPSLRGAITRWLIEVQSGVFVGNLSVQVRERLWTMVEGRKRLGRCLMIVRANNEQGFTILDSGESKRVTVDSDGLALVRKTFVRASARAVATANPVVEACGGDLLVKGPVEAGTLGRELRHLERAVLPAKD